jgi:lysozyme family protein
MMDAFDHAFYKTLEFEGRYSNDPDDPGGETRYGISKQSYPDVDIATLTIAQAKVIYRRDYWDVLNLNEIGSYIIASEIFDTAVNMGRRNSIKIAQKALNFLGEDLLEDGIIGPKTIYALQKWYLKDERALFVCLNGFQFMRYFEITESNMKLMKFSRGWTKRIQTYKRPEVRDQRSEVRKNSGFPPSRE